MTDRILADAAELAFPRYPGTDGDDRAIAWVEGRLRKMGLTTSLEYFSYDIGPAQRALQAVMVTSAVLVVAAYLSLGLYGLTGRIETWDLLPLLSIPSAVGTVRSVLKSRGRELNDCLASSAKLAFAFSVLLSVGLAL